MWFARGEFMSSCPKSDDVRYNNYNNLFDAKMYQGVAGEMIRKMFEPRDISAITQSCQKFLNLPGAISVYRTVCMIFLWPM